MMTGGNSIPVFHEQSVPTKLMAFPIPRSATGSESEPTAGLAVPITSETKLVK